MHESVNSSNASMATFEFMLHDQPTLTQLTQRPETIYMHAICVMHDMGIYVWVNYVYHVHLYYILYDRQKCDDVTIIIMHDQCTHLSLHHSC